MFAVGGSVYVVLVHTGSAATGSLVGPGLEYRYNVTLKSPPDGSSAVKKLPPSNSGSHNGDMWNYPISFAQDMQMFSNGGSQLTTFPAQYEDSVDLNNGQQTGFVNGSSGTQWGIRFDVAPQFHQNFPFASLCLWKVESLTQINFDCEASVVRDDEQMEAR
ncbi:hypothetical protein ONZ45_g10284 [Pleurotus djamor]|nr:hypothetical protein ONZ45_g10284 [Pleurotus djamor]